MALKDINFQDIRETAKDVAGRVSEAVSDTVEKLKRRDILTAPFMVEMIRTATNMYDHGWDERNGGNISLMLTEEEVAPYLDLTAVIREIPTGFDAPTLDGKYFLVTGTGKDLDETFGLIETAEKAAEIYMKIAHLPLKTTITDDELWLLVDRFEVEPREGYLAPRE